MKYCIVWFKGRQMYIVADKIGVKEYKLITVVARGDVKGELHDFDAGVDGVKYYVERGLIQDVSGL